METIAPLSPFWTGDPATDLEETRVLARAVGGADPADPWLIYTTGAGRIPVVTPTALDPERPATIAVWRTPWPYLPADIWMRRPGEYAASYQCRMTLTLAAMGLIEADGQHAPWTADMGEADEAAAQSLTAGRFGTAQSEEWETRRDRIAQLAAQTWPDGYPIDDLLAACIEMSAVVRAGSAVMSAHAALTDQANGDPKRAVATLQAAKRLYPDLFDPQGMDPRSVAIWVREHADRATGMFEWLASAGLAGQEDAAAVKEVLQ